MTKLKQKEKTKFRNSSAWKSFRIEMKKRYNGMDPLTKSPLYAGWNLHHCDLNPEHYTDISNPAHFLPLNKKSHDFVHFCFTYYKKDHDFLLRLTDIMKKMEELN